MPNPRPHRDFGALAARAVHLAWWVQRPRGDHDFTHKEKTMRTTQLLTAAGLLALGACAPAISVRTALSPDASLTGLQPFRVLPTPQPKVAGAVSSTNDPMPVNSISNLALRPGLAHEFPGPGYVARDR